MSFVNYHSKNNYGKLKKKDISSKISVDYESSACRMSLLGLLLEEGRGNYPEAYHFG